MDRTNAKVNVINDRFRNQQDKIIEHLQSFGSISPKEALQTLWVYATLCSHLQSKTKWLEHCYYNEAKW